jgi:hypothetical protein
VTRTWQYGDPPPYGVRAVRDQLGFYWWREVPPEEVRSDYDWTDGEERWSWLKLVKDRGPVADLEENL